MRARKTAITSEDALFASTKENRLLHGRRKARASFTAVEDYQLDLNLMSDSDHDISDKEIMEVRKDAFKKKGRVPLQTLEEEFCHVNDIFV
jgi:hypothetical protein